MSLRESMSRKRDEYRDALMAIRDFDVKAMKKLLNNGFNVRQIAEDEYLCWDIRRNLFPEADNLENLTDWDKQDVKMISDKLAKGHEILKILMVLIHLMNRFLTLMVNFYRSRRFPPNMYVFAAFKNNYPSLSYAVSPEALKIMLSG